MPRLSEFRSLVVAHTALTFLVPLHAQQAVPATGPAALAAPAVIRPAGSPWSASKVELIDGLPGLKPHGKGTLTLDGQALTFTAKAASASIPRSAITSVRAGHQRVELWGASGRMLRMFIPDGGGVVIAAFAHHRIDMLTVGFTDDRGGMHSAVFFLGANQAGKALDPFALPPRVAQPATEPVCRNAFTEPGALLVAAPDWQRVQAPAAYQALTYERLVEQFGRAKGVAHVYREGDRLPVGLCPQYVLRLSITGFQAGSSIKRAMLGPVGMFVGTTRMTGVVRLSDRTGAMNMEEPVKSTVRGEEESTDVARNVARTLQKRFEKALKQHDKETAAK